jgi:CRISPR type III-A-associated RAMP protein Csm4
VFVDWLNGKITRSWLAEHTVLLPNQVLVKRDEADRLLKQYGSLHLWGVDDVTRVAVDRITNASNVYQAGRLAFVKGGGLWCAVSCLDWDVSDVRRVLGLMEDGGIGGERFSGYGQFKLLERSFALDLPAPSERPGFVTLSHYYPQRTERAVFGANAAYSIIQRRGWMSSPDGSNLRRPAVRMIAAGGVLHSLSGENVYGGLADVTPGAFGRHPVWRYGYALGIGAYLA